MVGLVVEVVEEVEGGEKSWKVVISAWVCEGRVCVEEVDVNVN